MEKDFHYFGTYAAALIAGYEKKDAEIIAYAAQYVDDSDASRACSARVRKDGYLLDYKPRVTVQTNGEIGWAGYVPTIPQWQLRHVWAPFHFLPGNYVSRIHEDPTAKDRVLPYKGPMSYSGWTVDWRYNDRSLWQFKLMCRPLSPLVAAMISDCARNHRGKPWEMHLIGLRMHVLCDTWAHNFFAGTPAWHVNDVGPAVMDDTREPSAPILWVPPTTDGREWSTPAVTTSYESIFYLGHGRMGHLPDYPWAMYSYNPMWSDGIVKRNNPNDYKLAFAQMITALKAIQGGREYNGRDIVVLDSEVEKALTSIFNQKSTFGGDTERKMEIRCDAWAKGFSVPPPPRFDPDAWVAAARKVGGYMPDTKIFSDGPSFENTDYFYFNKAADLHFSLVNRELTLEEVPLTDGPQ